MLRSFNIARYMQNQIISDMTETPSAPRLMYSDIRHSLSRLNKKPNAADVADSTVPIIAVGTETTAIAETAVVTPTVISPSVAATAEASADMRHNTGTILFTLRL